MNDLSTSSRLAATDLRRAEHAIVKATRETAQFLVTTLDISEAHSLSPAIGHAAVRATIGALSALAESQGQLGVRAHLSLEKVGRALGLTVTDWGAGDPKVPSALTEPEPAAM